VRAWDVKHDTNHCEKCQLHFCRWHCWRDHYLWIACTNYDHLRPRATCNWVTERWQLPLIWLVNYSSLSVAK